MNPKLFLELALHAAHQYDGVTAPNPPVGAVVVLGEEVLGVGAHAAAGMPHAEVVAIECASKNASERGLSLADATLYVTLEPCNHFGKTPPCTQAILKAGIRKVVIGIQDPNPKVEGRGAEQLRRQGIDVSFVSDSSGAEDLIAGFAKHSKTGRPWVTHKIALRLNEAAPSSLTMIPDSGKKTFAGRQGLIEAHLERRRSDAILTTVDTILADLPSFTVREVQDHKSRNRARILAVVSRRSNALSLLPEGWKQEAKKNGFELLAYSSTEAALQDLGERDCLRVLVEAGPRFSEYLSGTEFSAKFVDEKLWILTTDGSDRIFRKKTR